MGTGFLAGQINLTWGIPVPVPMAGYPQVCGKMAQKIYTIYDKLIPSHPSSNSSSSSPSTSGRTVTAVMSKSLT